MADKNETKVHGPAGPGEIDEPLAAPPPATTTAWDVAAHLHDDERITAYLEAVLDEGDDPQLLKAAIADVARALGMTMLSELAGIARADLFDAMEASSGTSSGTISSVLGALAVRTDPLA